MTYLYKSNYQVGTYTNVSFYLQSMCNKGNIFNPKSLKKFFSENYFCLILIIINGYRISVKGQVATKRAQTFSKY